LQDLALYKKFREKEVASAARGLITLFREIAPGMLEKKDRGRNADLAAAPMAFGAHQPSSRVEGADLLQAAIARGDRDSSDEAEDDDSLAGGESDDEVL
jgi:protein SDA1